MQSVSRLVTSLQDKCTDSGHARSDKIYLHFVLLILYNYVKYDGIRMRVIWSRMRASWLALKNVDNEIKLECILYRILALVLFVH